jgi:peptidoglycan/LPS O-acetylase OafA/YrhL
MKYRAEIDGLRALAVLPVILFHAGFECFSGGFVGVDVFFVISGYLITTIIISEMAAGKFSIVNFYERRARRILPALFFMMLLCIPPAYLYMLPDPLENFGQSLVSTSLFSNNILLLITSGYWDLASEYKPLLHTWSLAVEEQYYIIFPILMLLLWKLGRNAIFICFVSIIIISLYFAQVESDRDIAFYSLHTRAFELLLGALMCGYFLERPTNIHPLAKNIFSLTGLLMIFYSILFFDDETRFPSVYTLVPVIGTCLVIYFTDKTAFVHKILSNKALVSIGLVSYSAYLFHQPILSFLKIYSVNLPSTIDIFFAIAITFVLAWISYKFIESPFRNKEKFNRTSIFSFAAIVMFSFSSIGIYFDSTDGLPDRLKVNASPLEKSSTLSQRAWAFKNDSYSEDGKLNVLVIGNSFGRDVVNMLIETFNEEGFEIIYRDDMNSCSLKEKSDLNLFTKSDIIIFASSYSNQICSTELIKDSLFINKTFFMGDKNFGHNLNWVMRISKKDRSNLRNPLDTEYLKGEANTKSYIPESNFISFFDSLVDNNQILITTDDGDLLSDDRSHLTLTGAQYVGQAVFIDSQIENFFKSD